MSAYESNDIFRAVGQREVQWTEKSAKPRLPYERLYRELHGFKKISPQPHIDSLKKYLELAKCLGYSREIPLNRPVLRHPDLQPNNILISDSLDIIGLIDWQHATVVPLCLAAGIPKDFHNYGDPESERLVQPAGDLPSDVELLSPDEQASVKQVHIRRSTISSTMHSHYDTMMNIMMPFLTRGPFSSSVCISRQGLRGKGTLSALMPN